MLEADRKNFVLPQIAVGGETLNMARIDRFAHLLLRSDENAWNGRFFNSPFEAGARNIVMTHHLPRSFKRAPESFTLPRHSQNTLTRGFCKGRV